MCKYKILLAGNPNVGKSSIFNCLTGLKQHTGNWTGKTVSSAKGYFEYKGNNYEIIDIPGIYSLNANSEDEILARNYMLFEDSDITIIVCDATALERNLLLFLQTIEFKKNVILCINLIDEAKAKNIEINLKKLEKITGVYVVGTNAKNKEGINNLLDKIDIVSKNQLKNEKIFKYDDDIENCIKNIENGIEDIDFKQLNKRFISLKILQNDKELIKNIERYLDINLYENEKISSAIKISKRNLEKKNIKNDDLTEEMNENLYKNCSLIFNKVCKINNKKYYEKDIKIDNILTSKKFGIPIMLLILCIIFWITIVGANYPSNMLSNAFLYFEKDLYNILNFLNIPSFVISFLIDGVYRVVSWVVSVMLPPMAIFFPLFTILEDLGYLPRVAFNLDKAFKKCGACGKQALTMAMGFGCNSAGVIGCRIIDSKRERLIAILTNNFVPCNGRFPIIISIITMFFLGNSIGIFSSVFSALFLTLSIVLGIIMTFLVSNILSKTILKGESSNFNLELPPYRKPKIFKNIVNSIFDRTLFVLGRAVIVSIPAGIIIFFMANTFINGESILFHITSFLNPIANLIGLDGAILMAFLLGFPANEIVIPLIIMIYTKGFTLVDIEDLNTLKTLLINNNWTINTAICTIIFTLFHWPCSTTFLTIKNETNSYKWAFIAFLLPTFVGILVCGSITLLYNLIF